MRKEPVMEICLAAAGVFFGSLLPAIGVLGNYAADKEIGLLGLLTCFLAVGALTVSLVTGFLWKQRAKAHGGMIDSIRGRNRVPVQ